MGQIAFLLCDFFCERQHFFIIFTDDNEFRAIAVGEFSWKIANFVAHAVIFCEFSRKI